MKNNNSKLTPRGYDSYEVFNDGETQINILNKKSFFDKYWFVIMLVVMFLIWLPKHWNNISIVIQE
jgi:hypothetical protein